MIEKYNFGRMTINGRKYREDLKIIESRVKTGWQRDRGHLVDAEDLADVLASPPGVLVVGMGYIGRMKIAENLRAVLSEKQIELIAARTPEAQRIFNRLDSEGKNVIGVFHLTC